MSRGKDVDGAMDAEAVATPDDEQRYVVRVAPSVLATIVRRSVQSVPGVVRFVEHPPRARKWPGGSATYQQGGVRLAVADGRARVAVHVVIQREHNLQQVGAAVQREATQALDTLVGMDVDAVDVYVQDVD